MKNYFLDDEFWYGGATVLGVKMPISKEDSIEIDLRINNTPNQSTGLFLSSKGRYIYSEIGFLIKFDKGCIETDIDLFIHEGHETLKGAFKESIKNFKNMGMPSIDLFKNVIYNTWIEMTFFQNQKDILEYANNIVKNEMPVGTLMIDDGWSTSYGDWTFHTGKFQDPKFMIEQLHSLGFKVLLWLCPFVTPDTVAFRELEKKDLLIKNLDGSIYISKWWNGYSAVLDFTKQETINWMNKTLKDLLDIGIDGFKFDAGDSIYYKSDALKGKENEHSICWAEFAQKYEYNELRVCFNAVGLPLLQRLCDKNHSWDSKGINTLVPDTLLAGIIGYPYTCPDMIGGGEYLDFEENKDKIDSELFLAHASIASMLPAMQFSVAPWRILKSKDFNKLKKIIDKRQKYIDLILEELKNSSVTGEPVVRYMEYEFPNQGMQRVIDQYMLGKNLLVAPIYEKNKKSRFVKLPKGKWKNNLEILDGETEIKMEGEDGLVILERVL